jgi:hypothetical protein
MVSMTMTNLKEIAGIQVTEGQNSIQTSYQGTGIEYILNVSTFLPLWFQIIPVHFHQSAATHSDKYGSNLP